MRGDAPGASTAASIAPGGGPRPGSTHEPTSHSAYSAAAEHPAQSTVIDASQPGAADGDQPSAPEGAHLGGANAAAAPLGLLELLQAFFEAQDVRCSTYQRLHAGFRSFLSDRNEASYRCAACTALRTAVALMQDPGQ